MNQSQFYEMCVFISAWKIVCLIYLLGILKNVKWTAWTRSKLNSVHPRNHCRLLICNRNCDTLILYTHLKENDHKVNIEMSAPLLYNCTLAFARHLLDLNSTERLPLRTLYHTRGRTSAEETLSWWKFLQNIRVNYSQLNFTRYL